MYYLAVRRECRNGDNHQKGSHQFEYLQPDYKILQQSPRMCSSCAHLAHSKVLVLGADM